MREIPKVFVLFFCASCFMLNSALVAAEENIRTERITFKRGATGTVIKNRIKGYETVDYVLRGAAGQRMLVVLETDNLSNYFNVMASGTDRAMHIGSSSGNRFEAKLPTSGDYTIRVYMMRNAARRNETASYFLAVNIVGSGTSVQAPQKEIAGGLGGGPNFWEVAGVMTGFP
ncbi:MAG: DNA breaking-rejoining protein [Gammaproteobacteria bacterium]